MDATSSTAFGARPYRLNDILVEPSALRLSGPQGETLLEPKVMALLVALSERPNELWPRGDLIEAIWQNGFGSDESLTRLVSMLRKALSDEHSLSDAVVTVPKLGYRLDAVIDRHVPEAVQEDAVTPPPPKPASTQQEAPNVVARKQRRGRFALYAIGVAALAFSLISLSVATTRRAPETPPEIESVFVIPDKSFTSVAVLPIENLGSDQSRAFLADGMTRDLTARLSRVPNLRVAPYSSARVYTETKTNNAAAAAELDVQYVVSGSLTEQSNKLVLRIALVDETLGRQVWSKRFSRPLDAFFDLQEEVIQDIATSIFSEIQASQIVSIRAKEDFSFTVYELIQKAEAERTVYGKEAAQNIVKYLAQALEIDPENATAKSFLAIQLAQNTISQFSDDPARDVRLSMRYLEEAQTVAPRDPQVLMGAGIVKFMTGNSADAERLLTQSLQINPNEAHTAAMLGFAKCYLGRTSDGLSLIRNSEARAQKHPNYSIWAHYRGICLAIKGDLEASTTAYSESIDRNPNFGFPRYGKAINACLLGAPETGRVEVKTALRIIPDFGLEDYLAGSEATKYPGVLNVPFDALKQIARECLGDVSMQMSPE